MFSDVSRGNDERKRKSRRTHLHMRDGSALEWEVLAPKKIRDLRLQLKGTSERR